MIGTVGLGCLKDILVDSLPPLPEVLMSLVEGAAVNRDQNGWLLKDRYMRNTRGWKINGSVAGLLQVNKSMDLCSVVTQVHSCMRL